ncbi:MAG: hypothetical protein CSA36_00480 [Draconibacterium sp.]|nr:MAG: hypothetical protein CSA36_00480 [Draconibacterium sp.]
MKKVIFILGCGFIAATMFLNFSKSSKLNTRQIDLSSFMKIAKADAEGGGYSCTVYSNCFNIAGTVTGSVSCTGTESCSRGTGWVKCDGHKTEC